VGTGKEDHGGAVDGDERRGFSEEDWQLAAAGINALGLKGIHYVEFGSVLLMAAWVRYLLWCFLSNPLRNFDVPPLNMMILSSLVFALPACIVGINDCIQSRIPSRSKKCYSSFTSVYA
jgi:hypothetical protein